MKVLYFVKSGGHLLNWDFREFPFRLRGNHGQEKLGTSVSPALAVCPQAKRGQPDQPHLVLATEVLPLLISRVSQCPIFAGCQHI